MAIYHDAYLFKLKDFLTSVKPYIQALKQESDGYGTLRSHALQIFERNEQVRKLSNEYGSWDKKNILLDFPSASPYSADDVAFWIVLILYADFVPHDSQQLGLGHYHNLLGKLLPLIGWEQNEVRLLIRGNGFDQLSEYDPSIGGDFWNYVRPFSTAKPQAETYPTSAGGWDGRVYFGWT